MLTSFHFLRPLWLLLLIIPIIGYRRFFIGRQNISAWESVCDKNLLDFLLIKGNSKQRSFIGYSTIIGIVFAIIALSGPSWQKKETPVFAPLNPVMILLNMSSDMDNNDIAPNRLSRAKFAIDDLLKDIQAQTGLIVYTNEPFLISPVTEDKKIISNLLPSVVDDIMPENGDKLYRAIDMAAIRLKEEGYPFGNIVIIAPDVGQDFEKALSSAASASGKNYKTSVIAARADKSEKLALLAAKGGGVYAKINDISPLISQINSQISTAMEQSKNKQETWNDGGYWFVFIPLVCLMVFFRRGVLILIITLISFSAQAGFFTNNNQDGAKFFEQENYSEAAKSFEHPQWKASSLYKQQKYDEALKLFEQDDSVEGIYNQGNALAKSGKIDEAIQKYEQVLQQNPNHEDAKFNLEYLKKQQEQQHQQQQNQQDNSDSQDNENQNSGDNDSEQQNNEDNQNQEGGDKQENQNNEQNNNDDSSSQNEQDSSSKNNQDEQNQQDSQNLQDTSGEQNNDEGKDMPQPAAADSSPEKPSEQDASAQAQQQQEDVKGDFDEQTQAREMTYRNIPEDTGGLLRAFILKEYNKNRYGDK